jgi:hypothetical protein
MELEVAGVVSINLKAGASGEEAVTVQGARLELL